MAGKFDTKNVFVDTEYDNIIIIDPNLIVDAGGSPSQRLVDHEDLVYYANLETKVVPRSKFAVGEDLELINTGIASFVGGNKNQSINFLQPLKNLGDNERNYFDTSWSDQITGKGSKNFQGVNQTVSQTTFNKTTDELGNQIITEKTTRSVANYKDTQTLGIKSIRVNVSAAGVPTVDMTLIDIQGRTLFEQGENSLYSVFFNLPYPAFYLTLKGYYGKAIRYQLALISFNAKLDSSNGNFDITLKLIGRPSALLFDTLLTYGKTLPKMYRKEISRNGKTIESNQAENGAQSELTIDYSLGRQYLDATYNYYESKGLISPNFPKLSIEDFINRVENFNTWLKQETEAGNFGVLSDVYKFRSGLQRLKSEVYDLPMSKYLDLNKPYNINDEIYYPYKAGIDETNQIRVNSQVSGFIKNINTDLKSNPTLSNPGTYRVYKGQPVKEGKIDFNFEDNIIVKKTFATEPLNQNDYEKTYKLRTGLDPQTNQDDFTQFQIDLTNQIQATGYKINGSGNLVPKPVFLYKYGTKNKSNTDLIDDGFLSNYYETEKNLKIREQQIEEELGKFIATFASTDKTYGIGFVPSIRNIFAILFAGVDSFYRLMDKTHRDAWQLNENGKRLEVIEEGKNKQSTTGNNRIVYPWPQYYVQETVDGKTSYVIQYIGDPNFTKVTESNNYTLWPEVEFTEEFLTAMTTKLVSKSSTPGTATPKKTQINSIYNQDLSYTGGTTANFLTEFLERSYVNAHYGRFNSSELQKKIKIQLADLEGENINGGLNNSVEIIDFFKNQVNNSSDFYQYIQKNFLSSWFNYKNNIFSTEYINNQVNQTQQSILSTDYLDTISVDTNTDLKEKLIEYLDDTISNEKSFLDIYPFTENGWLIKNMANVAEGGFKETTKIYTINDNIEKVIRDNKDKEGNEINLITNNAVFSNSVKGISNPTVAGTNVNSAETLKKFFEDRKDDIDKKDFFISESEINYGPSYSGSVQTKNQTNTIFNTPYFVNAIIKGVELEKASASTESYTESYAALGYLFLNSLPLITTKERLKNIVGNDQSDSNFLSSSFNKISAYHKLPYAWILKYGSIWYRYKKWIETGDDILTDVWKDLDYSVAYDPKNNDITKLYNYRNDTGTISSVILQNVITTPPVIGTTESYNVGFYPKIINDLYYYFSKRDLFVDPVTNNFDVTDATILTAQNNKNLNIYTNTKSSFNVDQLPINNDTQYMVKSMYVEMDVLNNTDLPFFGEDLTMIFPSMGSFGNSLTGNSSFNQSMFECFNDQKQNKIPLKDNPSFYNGSVRSLWKCPNFGYFDNSKIKKPEPYEYMKKVRPAIEIQSSYDLLNYDEEYSSIEEIFGIFDKETLDLFEKYFILFISPKAIYEAVKLDKEEYQATTQNVAKNLPVKYRRLFYLMKNLFCVDKIVGDPTNKQMESFTSEMQGFLNEYVLFRNGNPGNFDRKLFNDFSESTRYATENSYIRTIPTPYLDNLPPETLILTSKSSYSDEWKTLQQYVGFSTLDNMTYSGQSYITDFFKDNKIGFTIDNIKKYAPLIKLYATYKLQDPTLNTVKFKTLVTNFLDSVQTYQNEMITETIKYLKNNLPNLTPVSAVNPISSISGNVLKLETYSTLKTLNDKWISGGDFQTKTLFEDFLFMDRANNDIGSIFTVDLFFIKGLLQNNEKATLMDIVSKILDESNFIFFAMPAYVNFYNLQKTVRDRSDGEKIEIPYDVPNSLFGTYLNVDYINSKPKFLCMYVGKGSENLPSDAEFNKFDSDSMDLTKPSKQTISTSNPNIDKDKSNLVVGFNVDFGIQNQNIFKDLSLDMSEKKNTAETFRVNAELAESASGDKVAQQSTSLYSIYRTRSYTCGVSSLGNAMIQPTMYFNLKHVPLFRGAYWIHEVTHDIDSKEFKTDFKGTRMPIFSFPKPDSYTASINKSLIERFKPDAIKTGTKDWVVAGGYKRDPSIELNNTPLKSVSEECKDNLYVDYKTFSAITAENRIITGDELKDKLNLLLSTNRYLRALIYGGTMRSPSNRRNGNNQEQLTVFNNNLLTFDLKSKYGASIRPTFIKDVYACVNIENVTTPIISFPNYDECIKMAEALYGTWVASTEFTKLINKSPETSTEGQIADALSRFYITMIENKWTKSTGPTVDDIFNNDDVLATINAGVLSSYIKIFEYSLKKVS